MMNTEQAEYMRRDTQYVLSREYTRNAILFDIARSETPIFDALAADRFASDRTTFNLGDYR